MITTQGAAHIKRFMAGGVGRIAGSIALGIGSSAESLSSTRLDFEVIRADVTLSAYDANANRIIYKATLPSDFIGTVYEVGIWSMSSDAVAGNYGSRSLATFESASETWTGTFSSTNTRVGVESLQHTPAVSTSTTSAMTGIVYDLSAYSAADRFVFAYNVGNANTSNILIRFMTDASNYYQFSLGAQTVGYKVTGLTKGSATVTGSPNWASITEIDVITTSGAGGASAISYDGIRIEDMDTINPDYLLVARKVLSTPFVKNEVMAQDAEFAFGVNIT